MSKRGSFMRRSAVISGLALLLAAPLSACASELRVAITGDPVGLDPALDLHSTGKLIVQQMGEALVGYREDLTIAPVLAEKIDISPDGRSYRFHLRRNARFHNGAAVTGEDVVWVWKHYYLDPARRWECLPYYDGSGTTESRTSGAKVEAVTAPDAHSVEFRLREPSSLFLHRLADTSCAPLVFHRSSVGANGQFERFIGTGPFEFVEWRRGQYVQLDRNPDYVPRTEPRNGYGGGRRALVDTLRFVVVGNTANAAAALREGRIDVWPDVSRQDFRALRGAKGVNAIVTPLTSWYDVLIQTTDPLLSDVRVRRAIAHAIDADGLARTITEGRQNGNPSVIPRTATFHTAAHEEGVPFDLAKAKALLAQAGYDNRVIKLQASADGYPLLAEGAVLVRDMLRAAGLNVEIQMMSWKEQLDTHYRSGSFQLQLFLLGGRNSPTLAYGKFIGSKASLPRFQWDDPAALALVHRAERSTDEEALQGIYDELHRRMIDAVPTVALFNDERFDLVRVGIEGYRPAQFMRVPLWGVRKTQQAGQ